MDWKRKYHKQSLLQLAIESDILRCQTPKPAKMSIQGKQFIAIHLKDAKTISTQASGRFLLRFHIYQSRQGQNSKSQPDYAIPFNIVLPQKGINSQQMSETIENCYQTRSFVLKPGNNSVPLNEVCIFKYDFDLFAAHNNKNRMHHLQFCAQLVSIDYNSKKVISVFEGRFYSTSGSQFLCIDFHSPHACQIIGSVHSCLYNYNFNSNQLFQSLEDYCARLPSEEVEKLLKYLLDESKQNQNKLKEMTNEHINPDLEKTQVQKLKKLVLVKRNSELITEPEQELKLQRNQSLDTRNDASPLRKRKKIFERRNSQVPPQQIKFKIPFAQKKEHINKIEGSDVSVSDFMNVIHSNALKVYESWNKLIRQLVNDSNCPIVKNLERDYNKKVQQRMGECIVKFKGSFDIDTYSNEAEHRNKMAYQLRNRPIEILKQLNEFHFSDYNLWDENRPIFFEQQMDSHPTLIKEVPHKLYIFLVHGLGACRLDMEKLKNELKRHYGCRVQVFVSSSNEGRTEGDISGMSTRFASEVEHLLSKEKLEQKSMISFIGHSMGGLIIRGSLPYLKKYKHLFYSLVTLSSPHIGYSYSTSKLVDAGIWVINNWKKCQSLIQLTMEDTDDIQKSFIYNLSQQVGLEWFSKITFVSSRQDLYVPYYSARVQKSEQCIADAKKGLKKGKVHTQIIDNILNSVKGKVTRIDVNFSIKEQNVDNLIGRAAHISFINSFEVLKTLCHCGDRVIF